MIGNEYFCWAGSTEKGREMLPAFVFFFSCALLSLFDYGGSMVGIGGQVAIIMNAFDHYSSIPGKQHETSAVESCIIS